MDEAACLAGMDTEEIPAHQHINAYAERLLLLPETRYEARVMADSSAVFRWQFITSRFAHFRHHIGSFRDRLWDERTVLSAQQVTRLEALVRAERDGAALPAGDAPRFDEAAYLLGFAIQPLGGQPARWLRAAPKHLDVSLLSDADRSYAVLIESPEPLSEERVVIGEGSRRSALFRATDGAAPAAASTAKLTEACIPTVGQQTNDEYVDILLFEHQDLGDWRIEHAAGGDPAVFANYYTFAPPCVLGEGTLVRVHSGLSVEERTATYEHRYVGANQFQFDSGGSTIRLVDAAGNVKHSRFFLPSSPNPYTRRSMVQLWNADRTNALLFFPQAAVTVSPLRDGHYRLVCTFHRNVSGEPLLKQENETGDEVANIDFVIGAVG